jgi:cobalt-zinc-cadmium efflux system outer membrane protein
MLSFRINRASWRPVIFIAGITLFGGISQTVEAVGLTLPQAIGIAVQGNRDLQAARYIVEVARARLLQAGLPPNPRLNLGGSNDFLFNNAGEYVANVGISQQFPVAGRIARQKDVARVDIALALTEISQAERNLAGEVAKRFYQVLVLDRQIQLRDRLTGIDKNLVKVTRDRFRVAEVSELDVNTAQLELQRLVQERALLQNQRALQWAQLNQLLGRPSGMLLSLEDVLPPTSSPLPPLNEELDQALALRPDLRAALLSADRAQADLALAKAQRWEDWTVSVGLEQGRRVIEGAPPQSSDRLLGVTLSIPLPLLNKNQGRIAEASASGSQAQVRIEALKLSISNDVSSAYSEAERLRAAVQQYEDGMLQLSDRNVRLAQQGYNMGQTPILAVVQAQRQQSDLYIAYQNTLSQYLQALVALHTAVSDYAGRTLPSEPNTDRSIKGN